MIDNQGRTIDYIRISVTDRCNLRCVYCMPEEGLPALCHEDILTFEEIVRICKILAAKGFKKVKLTGGEPLVRKNIDVLVNKIKEIEGIESVTLTTNGVLLKDYYHKLVDAGIDAITVSLDTTDHARYQSLTRRDYFEDVMAGINFAREAGQVPLKINCVLLDDAEEMDIINILNFAKDTETDVRFIEMMPIGLGRNFKFISTDRIVAIIEKNYGKMTPCSQSRGNGPAVYYQVQGLKGKVGFISALSHKFCEDCNRIRLTADGRIKACLQYTDNVNLKQLLNQPISDEKIALELEQIILNKPIGHHFEGIYSEETDENRKMSQIGG